MYEGVCETLVRRQTHPRQPPLLTLQERPLRALPVSHCSAVSVAPRLSLSINCAHAIAGQIE